MRLKASLSGLDTVRLEMKGLQKKMPAIIRGAINTTASKTRQERYVKPLTRAISPKVVRKALRVSRARSRRMSAWVIPSSASVPVLQYKQWGYEDAGHPTRARIWVIGPDGRKVAAGFINPSSAHKLPLASYKTRKGGKIPFKSLQPAQGLSAAYWFQGLTGGNTLRWVNVLLKREMTNRVNKEIAK